MQEEGKLVAGEVCLLGRWGDRALGRGSFKDGVWRRRENQKQASWRIDCSRWTSWCMSQQQRGSTLQEERVSGQAVWSNLEESGQMWTEK